MQIKRTILAEATEPISLEEATQYLKVDYTTDDSLILGQITAVRELMEQHTGLSLIASEIEYFNDEIPTEIELPYPEHDQILEVKINGEVSDNYTKTGLSGLIIYPAKTYVSTQAEKGIYVKYTTLGSCPKGLWLCMLKEIDEAYRNRGNTFEGQITELSNNAYAMAAKYCRV